MSTTDTGSEADDYSEEGFTEEEVKLLQKFESQGYRIMTKDAKTQMVTMERSDEIKCLAKIPSIDALQETASLSFGGRVKMPSKKNTQLEMTTRGGRKLKPLLQHGKFNNEIFILDYGYPLSPIQAFAISLGLQNFSGSLDKKTK